MRDIVMYINIKKFIATAQDNVKMDWLVYDIKLGTLLSVQVNQQYTVSSLNICILQSKKLKFKKDVVIAIKS